MADRRGALRVNAAVGIEVEAGPDPQLRLRTTTRNISSSGAYCSVSQPLEEFTRLQVRLELPSPDGHGSSPLAVECVGIVVRRDTVEAPDGDELHSVAIYFDQISAANRQAIDDFVSHAMAGG